MPALALSDISLRFGGVQALSHLSLDIPCSSVTGLIGPNGAGKTTVFNVLTGFLRPDAGRVTFGTRDITGLSPVGITRLGIARSFQELRLFPALTVLENVLMAVPRAGVENPFRALVRAPWRSSGHDEARTRAMGALEYVDLAARAGELAGELGYGEQKLLSLARLLATGSDYLLLDEPAAGLDANEIERMLEVTRLLVSDGKTVCLVEHNIDIVARACERIVVLHQGTKVAEGAPAEVLRDRTVLQVYLGE